MTFFIFCKIESWEENVKYKHERADNSCIVVVQKEVVATVYTVPNVSPSQTLDICNRSAALAHLS